MNEYTAHYITCKGEFDTNGDYVQRVVLTDDIIEERARIIVDAEEQDDQLPLNLCRVFRDAAEYQRVFIEMMRAGMCFKMGGPLGMDIAATVIEMWKEYRAKFDDRPVIVRTEGEWEAMKNDT